MRAYHIVTDGACDLPQAWCKEHHITVLPLYYSIASAAPAPYTGTGSFQAKPYYDMLRAGAPVHTAAPSLEDCKAALRPILAGGEDIVYAGFSSQLSGMFNVMRIAAQELGEEFPERRIAALDTHAGSLGLGLLVEQLADAREHGLPMEVCYDRLNALRPRVRHFFTVSDLMHLKRGGRISGSTAVVGTVLQIMPLMHVDPTGALAAVGKVRGRRNALRSLADMAGEAADPTMRVYVGHCDAEEDAAFVREILRRKYAVRDVRLADIGPVIGGHGGPNTVAVFCIAKETD